MAHGSDRRCGDIAQGRTKRSNKWDLPTTQQGTSRKRQTKHSRMSTTDQYSRLNLIICGGGFLFFYFALFGARAPDTTVVFTNEQTNSQVGGVFESETQHDRHTPPERNELTDAEGQNQPWLREPEKGNTRSDPEGPASGNDLFQAEEKDRWPESTKKSSGTKVDVSQEMPPTRQEDKEEAKGDVRVTGGNGRISEEHSVTDVVSARMRGRRISTRLVAGPNRGGPSMFSWRKGRSETRRHIYAMGSKLDRVLSLTPACLNQETGSVLTVDQPPALCSGFNKTFEAWIRYCAKNEIEANRESGYQFENISEEAMSTLQHSAHFVPGVTVLQSYSRDSGNIAHFLGRVAWINHLMGNIESYGSKKVDNVLVSPNPDVMKRFLFAERYSMWHAGVLGSMVHPNKVDTEISFESFLETSNEPRRLDETRVYVLPDLNSSQSVCFEHLIVPAFLKGRFFIKDLEYPSTLPSYVGQGQGVPMVPRDSLRFRRRVNAHLFGKDEIPEMARKIVFVDRAAVWGRRSVVPGTKEVLFSLLGKQAENHTFEFEVMMFENRTLTEQVRMVNDAAIIVSVHGANLVNAIFMPPLAAVVEIFPFGFRHSMYHEGGGSGLKYYDYTVRDGREFPSLDKFASRQVCMDESHDCKVHYRDAQLEFTDEDFTSFSAVLESAYVYLDGL